MLKIGDFSKISRVSIKTLRYYDEIGLLKPSQIDRFTAYRYYTLDQLARLNRILALKDLGLSLEQIGHLLTDDMPAEQIRGMLRLKQAELRQVVEEEQERLARVEARLRQIEEEGKMPDYDVVLKALEPVRVASIRTTIPSFDTIGKTVGALLGELAEFVTTNQYVFAGPPMTIYYDSGDSSADVDFEVAVPVGSDFVDMERIKMHRLPGFDKAACVIHRGGYEGVGSAYKAVVTWIETNGYRVAGPPCEIYLHGGPDVDPSTYVTEIRFPVEKV